MDVTAATKTIKPQAGPQTAFLSSPADIAIYGGAAGGGKTWGLLIEPLRHIHNPHFRGVIFRRTSPQITNPGGLYDESEKVYSLIGGQNSRPHSGITWKFPSGAAVRFAHMQHEKNRLDWQGAQIPFIGFDELTHFEEAQFFYMLSRNRSLTGIRPYIRAATNPDADSWVAKLIAWWIDQETGYPIPERAGVLRWFARIAGEIIWADSRETLRARYKDVPPKSVTFIPARLEDNPILMKSDPGYLANLMALPLVDRERLLGGNWKIVPSGGKVFNRAWFEIVLAQMVPQGGEECRFWDFAATEKKLKGNDPDYTAGVKIRKVEDIYFIVDCVAVQAGPAEVDRLFVKTSLRDAEEARKNGRSYMARWEIEPGAAAKRDNLRLIKLLAGLDAKGIRPQGDKLTRAKPLAVQAEHGFVNLAQGAWNDSLLTHLHHQPDWSHDDIMDACSGAFSALAHPGRLESSYENFYGETSPASAEIEPGRDLTEVAAMLDAYEAKG